jgi:PEGA domain-containing protein
MKRNKVLSIAFILGAFLLIPAMPAQAHGFHGGWGWGWGWGGWGWGASWGYPAYGYPYYGYPYGYGYGNGYGNGRVSFARVKTDVDPEEARLYLDGKLIGTADDFDGYPDYLYLGKGHYKLEFRLEGYETKVIELDAEPGTTVKIDSKMPKVPGAKQYGSYGDVKLEGGIRRFFAKRNSATAPAESNDVRPNGYPESYPPPSGGRDENGDVQKAPAQNWRENPPPQPESSQPAYPPKRSDKSRLSLVVSPPDAAVYIDDRFVGTAEELGSLPTGLAVSAGKHTVTVSRPGFQDQSMDIQVEPGATQKIEISLKH